jgi:hypothetical protein
LSCTTFIFFIPSVIPWILLSIILSPNPTNTLSTESSALKWGCRSHRCFASIGREFLKKSFSKKKIIFPRAGSMGRSKTGKTLVQIKDQTPLLSLSGTRRLWGHPLTHTDNKHLTTDIGSGHNMVGNTGLSVDTFDPE